MALQVETYEIEESPGGTTPEVEAEAAELIERLDLVGQRELFDRRSKSDGSCDPGRMPYPEMAGDEIGVYTVLFPTRSNVGDYSAGIIPVRVLQCVALARERGWFDSMEVWHRRLREDPILVGTKKGKSYLLARWGDALKQFKELREEAKQILAPKARAMIDTALAELKAMAAAGPDLLVERKLDGQWVTIGGHIL